MSSLSIRFSLTSRLIYLLLLLICLTRYAQGQCVRDRLIPSLHRQSGYTHLQRLLTSSVSFYTDTQINTYTSGDQNTAAVAVLKNGGFVVTWHGQGQDNSGSGISAQMFDATGAPSGSELLVNTHTSGDQCCADICALQDGKFVITWQDNGQDGSDWGVYMRIFNADGTTFADNIRVNEHTSGDQSQESITALQNGGFVIIWHSGGQDGSGFGVYAKIFNADGTVNKAEFAVNTVTSGDQMYPIIASSPDSSFVIAWQDASSGNKDVRARIFSASGTAIAADFVVNTYTSNDQSAVSIATFPDNGFIMTWQSSGQGGNSGIFYQRYRADGSLYGTETQANTYTSNGQYNPFVATLSSTSFIIAWESSGEDGSGRGVFAQRYNGDGTKRGTEFQVNTFTNNDQGTPYVRPFQGNSYVMVWTSYGQDGSGNGVYGTIFMDCDAGKYMNSQSCVTSCPSQYYASSANYRCLACDSSCYTCSGSPTSCTGCSNGKYLSVSTCAICDGSCSTCSGSGSSACTSCSGSSYLLSSTCVTSCGNNYYPVSASNTCQACDGTCTTCSGSAATACTSCSGSRYLLDSTCVTDCGTSYYADSGTHTCQACDGTCNTCSGSGASACLSCSGSKYLLGSSCVTSCGNNYYPDSSTHTCKACDNTCNTCSGSSASACTSCSGSKYLLSSTCITSCGNNYYPDSNTHTCQACDSTCNTCSGSGDSACTSCSGSKYLQGSSCVTSCGTDYYLDSSTHTCQACDSTCTTCSGSGASACTSCSGSKYLLSSTCVTSCGNNYYPDSATHTCKACDSTCATCSGSATTCTSCIGSKYMQVSSCVTTCASGYLVDSGTHTCQACDSTCASCSGTATTCTACPTGRYLSKDKCLACDGTCNTCSDNTATSCLSCIGLRYLMDSSCITDCGTGKYANVANHECGVCDSTCTTCSGSATTCTSCSGGTYLLGSTCVTNCDAGYNMDSSNNKCEAIPNASTHTSTQKILAIILSSVFGAASLGGLAMVVKFYVSARIRRRSLSVQQIRVKSNSIAPEGHAKITVTPEKGDGLSAL